MFMGRMFQPFALVPIFGAAACTFATAIWTGCSSPAATDGSSLFISKSCPGKTPIFASLATMGASAGDGGLSFISAASVLKKTDAHPVDLIDGRSLHVNRGIDDAPRRSVGPTPRTQRSQLELLLKCVHDREVWIFGRTRYLQSSMATLVARR